MSDYKKKRRSSSESSRERDGSHEVKVFIEFAIKNIKIINFISPETKTKKGR